MFKIIVVLWFFRFAMNLFTNNLILRYLHKGYLKSLEKYNIEESDDIEKLGSKSKTDVMMRVVCLALISLFKAIMSLVGFILMLNMVKYDPTLVTKIFILWTVLSVLINAIKAKFGKNKNNSLIEATRKTVYEIEKFSLYKLICRIIYVLYWGYAIYLLFF